MAAVFAAAAERFGGCDAVLHGAATHGTPMRLVDVPLEEWEHVIATNLRSTFLVSRAALRLMVPARRGSIVLVSSAGVLRGFPLAAPSRRRSPRSSGSRARSPPRSAPRACA